METLWGGGGGGAWVKVVETGPNAKGEGLIIGGTVGRDAGGDWPNAVVIGPKLKDNERTSVEVGIG